MKLTFLPRTTLLVTALSTALISSLFVAPMAFAKKVAKAVETVVPCKRIAVAVIGLEVPHTHVHLIPVESIGDVNFEKPAAQMSPEVFAELASDISSAFENI